MNELKEKEPPPEFAEQVRQERPSLGALYLASPVLPICSPTFYRQAAKWSVFAAFAFFFLFSVIVAVLQTARVTADFEDARQAIDNAFASGKIPEIIVQDGLATVRAPQPFVAVDDGRSLLVLDTTGVYKGLELLQEGYDTGVILTRDTLFVLNENGQFQQVSLRDLETVFSSPIRFDAALVKRFIDLASVFVFLGLLIWRALLGPLYIIVLGLGVWAAASLTQKKISYSAVLVTGFYAAVPALYAEYLLSRIDAAVFLLFTLLLLIIWTVGLVAAVGSRRAGDWLRGERPLRAWRAVIGLPMLLVFALDAIFQWENGPWIVWLTAVVTVAALLIVGYLSGIRLEKQAAPEKVAPQS